MTEQKWDWNLCEALVLAGQSVSEIMEHEEFKGISRKYLYNQIGKRGFKRRSAELEVLAKQKIGKSLVDLRADGIESHHKFAYDTLEKMRAAIADHKIKGSVKELREMLDVFQRYIDAAESSYGLKGQDVQGGAAVSLNAMVALHIVPPSKASESVEVVVERVADNGSDVASLPVEGINQDAPADA
jgi:hypothetical protein